MNEKIAFVNALLFYSKENYFKSYTLERMEYVYHESSYAQKPFTEHCMPKLAAFFLENDLSELFKRVKISEKEKKGKILYFLLILKIMRNLKDSDFLICLNQISS